jgi:hypothetical protein
MRNHGLNGARTAFLCAIALACTLLTACNRSPTRTLTIKPGFTVITAVGQTINFSGVRLYKDGRSVLCITGTLGPTGFSSTTELVGYNNIPPFKDSSSLRLRFALAPTEYPGNFVHSGEGLGPPDRDVDPSPTAAEYTYTGGDVHLTLTVVDGKVTLGSTGP